MPVGFPDYYGGLTLPVTVEEGGTGQTSLLLNAVLVGQGTSGISVTNVGTAGQVLQVPSGGGAPIFQDFSGTITPSSLTITPYAVDMAVLGASGDLPATHAALNIAAPTGATADPLIVAKSAVELLHLTLAGDLSIAGALKPATVLALTYGGTGTASPSLTAGTGISITGSWPDNTIANTSNYATLADPLPIAHGGTGTASPGLTAGSNISISGSWPDQTIALNSAIFLGTSGAYDTNQLNLGSGVSGNYTQVGTSNIAVQSGVTGTILYIANSGVARLACMDASGNLGLAGTLHLSTPLSVADGGTGSSSPSLVAGTGISISGSWPNQTITNTISASNVEVAASADHTGQTSSIGFTTLLTPSTAGMYQIVAAVYVDSPTGTSTITAEYKHTWNGTTTTDTSLATASSTGGNAASIQSQSFYADASSAIQYSANFSSGGGADNYDVHVRLVSLPT